MTRIKRHPRTIAAVAVLAALAVLAAVLLGSGSPSADQADTSTAPPLEQWFSVLKDGETPDASTMGVVRAAGEIDAAQPPAATARVAVRPAGGSPIVVLGEGGIVCMRQAGFGGGCVAGDSIREAPVIVQGVGHDGSVKTTHFRALAGDGISAISVTTANGEVTELDVRNNVAFAEIPGRVVSWSWVSPDGAERSQSVTE